MPSVLEGLRWGRFLIGRRWGGKTFMRYFSDKQCGGPRKALKAAEAKLGEMKSFLDSAPRRQGKLTKTAEAKARKVLGAG